jgi:hypothetical protein
MSVIDGFVNNATPKSLGVRYRDDSQWFSEV